MKYLICMIMCSVALSACEQPDIRTDAANLVYKICIKRGENPTWCSCLRADLKTGFSKDVAYDFVNNYQHPLFNLELNGARLRCQCRINPARLTVYNLSCSGVKPLNF